MSVSRLESLKLESENFIKNAKWDEVSLIWEDVIGVSLQDRDQFLKEAMKKKQWNGIAPVREFKKMLDEQDANGNTKLHRAVLEGDKEAVKFLLSHYASTNIFNNNELYPLGLAKKNSDMEKILLKGGCYPSVRCREGMRLPSLKNVNTKFSAQKKETTNEVGNSLGMDLK